MQAVHDDAKKQVAHFCLLQQLRLLRFNKINNCICRLICRMNFLSNLSTVGACKDRNSALLLLAKKHEFKNKQERERKLKEIYRFKNSNECNDSC